MEQPSKRPALRLTRAQRKRRRRLRLIRNWSILILVCAALVALMAKGILWLLPKVNALLAGPKAFEAAEYDGTAYTFNPADERLVLVNANLPYPEEPSPELELADDNSSIRLETEAAQAYRSMAAAAQADGVQLVLNAGYLDADARNAVYETRKQVYLEKGKAERARHRLCGGYPQRGLYHAGHRLCRDTGLRVALGLCRRVRLYPALSEGPAGRYRCGVRAVALAVCGCGKRPCHPRQRAEP